MYKILFIIILNNDIYKLTSIIILDKLLLIFFTFNRPSLALLYHQLNKCNSKILRI